MNDSRRDTGRIGEELAAQHLSANGFRVIGRNYACAFGEVDLIAEGEDGLLFVEVRTRRRPYLVAPEDTVTRPKAARVMRTAQHYLMRKGLDDRQWRIDVIAVEIGSSGGLAGLTWYQNAVPGDLV